MSEIGKELISMKNIHKSFPGVKALKGVSFTLKEGEVHALIGENGAGKSTLIKIMTGAYQKDEGEIFINGNQVEIKNPIQAKELGIGAVYQDITLAPHLSVGENFFLGKLPRSRNKVVDWNRIYTTTRETLKELDIDIDPRMLVKNLTVAQQEMVMIAKTVHENARIVIFDEPTALLAKEEADELFRLIRRLKSNKVGVIYISHRLEEIFTICDTVTVMKDGTWVNTMPVIETNQDGLISMMVGRNMEDMYFIKHPEIGEKVLEVKGLTKEPRFRKISFDLHKGEILGFFGLVGSGRTDVVRCIFGADPYDSGEIIIEGKKAEINTPRDGIKYGMSLLPEDRKKQGLALALSVGINTNLASYDMISRAGVITLQKEKQRAEKYKAELNIKTPTIMQKVRNLSGGNQQKVVISKWLCRDSKIFIFDEPTVGVDVGAKAEIYRLFEKILEEGNSIVIISSYLPEVMGLSDRIVVFREGNCAGILDKKEFDDERILRHATVAG